MHWMVALLAAVLVSACGGGGGSSGSDPKTPTVQTTAPATLSMPLGVVQSYSVFGGVAPYSVDSSDVRVLKASVSDQTLILNSVGQGNATVTIRDRNGGSVAVAVTVGDPLTLSSSSVQTYVGDTVKVLISGGTPPYRVSTLDIALKGTIVGNELTLEMLSVGGPFDVVVLDARGQQAKMTVEKILAGSPQFNLAPTTASIPEGSTVTLSLRISGGVGPYTVQSLNPALLSATLVGNTVNVTNVARCLKADTPVGVQVIDSRGASAKATITLLDDPRLCPQLRLSPSAVTGYVGDRITVNIQGGSPPYRLGGIDPRLNATINANTIELQLLAVASGATVEVLDAVDNAAQVTANISAGPPQFNLAPTTASIPESSTGTLSLRISGGVGPYTVQSLNPALLSATLVGNTVNVTNVARCLQADTPVGVQVIDSRGASANATITLLDDPQICPKLLLSPSTVTGYVGDRIPVNIQGGLPPYRLGAIDPRLAATINANTIQLQLLAVASGATVEVLDAVDNAAKVTANISAGSQQFNLAPAAMTISETSTEPLSLLISGGTSPYTVRTSDLTLLQPAASTVTGSTVTLLTGTKGNRCVNGEGKVTVEIQDAKGAHATSAITITDNPSGCGNLKAVPESVTVTNGHDASVLIQGQASNGTIRLVSSRPDIATVSAGLDANGFATVNGVAAGTTDIIVTDSAQPGVSLTFKVTVQ
jgi:hypothetical protein